MADNMISSVTAYVHNLTLRKTRPWLVVGKGPTTDRITGVDLARYNVLTLNHACRTVSTPDLMHFTDLEAALACRDDLAVCERNKDVALCLPWHPHVANKPGREDLGDCRDRYPALAAYAKDKRLVSYNSTTAGTLPRLPGLPTIRVRYFSAVAAFNILAMAGIREVYTLGVDGGTGYAKFFDADTLLSNGRASFDAQAGEIANTVKKYKLNWQRL